MFLKILHILIGFFSLSSACYAYEKNIPTAKVALKFAKRDSVLQVQGKIDIESEFLKKGICLYIPSLDTRKKPTFDPLRHLEIILGKRIVDPFDYRKNFNHKFQFEKNAVKEKWLLPHILKLQNMEDTDGAFELSFNGEMLPTGDKEYILENIIPTTFDCDNLSLKEPGNLPVLGSMNLDLEYPYDWHLVANAEKESETSDAKRRYERYYLKNQAPVFLLIKKYYHHSLVLGSNKIEIFLKTPIQSALLETISQAYRAHLQWLGPFPAKNLNIVESSNYVRSDLLGLIIVNQPQQYIFKYLQDKYLNWKHWVFSTFLAAQWFGGSIKVDSPADYWLLAGVCDFITSEFLRKNGKRYNLFNHYDADFNLLSLNYGQIRKLSAAYLAQKDPNNKLIDQDIKSYNSYSDQNPLLFAKHSYAINYIRSIIGSDKLKKFFKLLVKKYAGEKISPYKFLNSLEILPYSASVQSKRQVSGYMKTIWSGDGWPDYILESFDKKRLSSGAWLATASVSNAGSMSLPSVLGIVDESGKQYAVPIKGGKMTQKITAIVESEPVNANVDPDYHIFDQDRFNNKSSLPKIRLFPLGTNTISDDSYTSIWLPYIFRRPGEKTSIAVQGATLRYIDRGIFSKFEFIPEELKASYHLRYEFKLSNQKANARFSGTHDYENYRTLEWFMKKSILQNNALDIDADLLGSVRSRQTMGIASSTHPTLSLGWKKLHKNFSLCLIHDNFEIEMAPFSEKWKFKYLRSKYKGQLICETEGNKKHSLHLKFFTGLIHNSAGNIPENVFFKINDLNESGVKVDDTKLPKLSRIQSLSGDWYLPFSLPFGSDALLIKSDLKMRFFYDLGYEIWNYKNSYEASGLGVVLPFGGDLVGIGSLTISKFSFLAVLYSRKKSEKNRRPSFLFDLSGKF